MSRAAARRQAARDALAGVGIDALLVTSGPDVRYLTGFTGFNGQLWLDVDDPAADRLLTDERYRHRAAVEAPDVEPWIVRDPVAAVAEARPDAQVGAVAEAVTWALARRLDDALARAGGAVVAVDDPVAALRQVKDDAELAALERACAITTDAMRWLLTEHLAPGMTERALARALEDRFLALGAEAVAFDTIVAGGPNGAVPHHAPGDRPIQAGELVTVDAGARVEGYHADCTRTVVVGDAEPDPRLAEVHALVARAQAAGRAAAVAGATGAEIDAACRQPIAEAGYGEAFVHGTGHGVGLEVHERPGIHPRAAGRLEPATALTVEPGVYLPGLGGVRIEDTVVIAPQGPARVLTDLPRGPRLTDA